MGNCLNSSSRVENAHPPQNASCEPSSLEFSASSWDLVGIFLSGVCRSNS